MADSTIKRGRDTHVSSVQPDAQFSQIKFPRVTSGTHKILVHLPLPGVRGRTIEQAILSVPVKDAWAAQTLTATPIAADWGPRKTTWNNQPTLRTGAIAAAQAAKTDGQRVEINVTAHVQAVADGAKHYGWQITSSSGANNRVYGFDATQNVVNDAWKLVIDFTEAPEEPSDLSPNGTLTGIEPMLTFDFVDNGGASTEMAALNVQVNSSASATGAWDSGEVAATLPEYDLAASAWSGFDGTTYYWRVRVKDGAGYWSGWSDWASFTYDVKPTLTINQPTGGLIWDPSPTILASISDGTVKAYRVRITKGNDKSKVVYDSGKLPGSGTTSVAHQVPFKSEGKRVLKDDADYWVNVRVWDNNQREATPGDPTWTGAWAQFHLDDDVVPSAPTGLTAAQIGETPRVRLSWARTGTTDAWVIVRDGEVIARLDADEVDASAGTYSWVDPTASPLVAHTYKVKAIDFTTKKQTTPSGEAYITTDAPGVWLLHLTDEVDVCLDGLAVDGFRTLDRRASYKPINAAYDVDVVHAFEGVVGGFAGSIDDRTPDGWEATRAAILAMKNAPHAEVQLVYGTTSVPVKLRNVSVAPSPEIMPANMLHEVSFEAQQTSDFEVSV